MEGDVQRGDRGGSEVAEATVMDALNGLVTQHSRWGFWECYDRLRLDGYRVNHMV